MQDLLFEFVVEVWSDQLPKGPYDIAVFVPATFRPMLRQKLFLYDIGKQDGIGSIGKTYQIEIALLGSTVRIGEILERCGHLGVQQVFLVGMGGTRDQAARVRLAELEHDVGGKLIRVILLASKQG